MLMLHQAKRLGFFHAQVLIVILYLISHLAFLTLLPVFADEAIYIRWAQLIIDDWQRYLFFPLNDGKTPLQMWAMVPFLQGIHDQLFAGRLLSVLIGLGQVFVITRLIKKGGGNKTAQILGMLYVTVLPFWFFYHRMALIDAQLTFFLSFVLWCLFELSDSIENSSNQHRFWLTQSGFRWLIWTGLGYSAAFYTKLPAVFFAPVFVFMAFRYLRFPLRQHGKQLLIHVFWIGSAGLIGVLGFLTLKFEPAFGQLFSRGNDFTFTIQEILTTERHTPFFNAWKMLGWLVAYLSPVIVLLPMTQLTSTQYKRNLTLLVLSSLIFALPFILLGKVLSPRYILPSAIGLLTASCIQLGQYQETLKKKFKVLFYLLISLPILWSLPFLYYSWFDVGNIPFVKADEYQYLTEWSAGFGNRQVTALILDKAKSGRVVVATEGTFGTLPDGILMDLHNVSVENIEVQGIGQPIVAIPELYFQKAQSGQTVYIVVNSHRMKMSDPRLQKVYSFARPQNGPSLDVYQIQP